LNDKTLGETVKVFQLEYPELPMQVLDQLELPAEASASLKMGTAKIQKGDWVPLTGYSSHEQHEISLILKGQLEIEIAGQATKLKDGEVVMIPAGEAHRTLALEDSELIWFWFGNATTSAAGAKQ
jgi:quercetin dioxygenase-like cupin family protein